MECEMPEWMQCGTNFCVQIGACSASTMILVFAIGFLLCSGACCASTCIIYFGCCKHDRQGMPSAPAETKPPLNVDANSHSPDEYPAVELSKAEPHSIPATAKDTPYEAQFAALADLEQLLDDADLREGWHGRKDDHGRPYYYNHETEESSWDPPVKLDVSKYSK